MSCTPEHDENASVPKLSDSALAAINYIVDGDSINVLDADCLKQGHWILLHHIKYTFPDQEDPKAEEGVYKNNLQHGIWRKYRESGFLESEITYRMGIEHGYAKMYYENGGLREEGFHKDGTKDGEWTYYDERGNKIEEIP